MVIFTISLFWPPYWAKKYFISILNWDFRYLSWLRQYQTGIFFLLKQCYYSANIFKKFRKWCFLPPSNTIRVKIIIIPGSLVDYESWGIYFSIALSTEIVQFHTYIHTFIVLDSAAVFGLYIRIRIWSVITQIQNWASKNLFFWYYIHFYVGVLSTSVE